MFERVSLSVSVLLILGSLLIASADAKPSGEAKAAMAQPPKPKPSTASSSISKHQAKQAGHADAQTSKSPKTKPGKENDSAEKNTKSLKLIAIEKNIITFTNDQRKRYGLPPLEIDEALVKSARNHAIWMAKNRNLQHTWRPVAENIAMGYENSQGVVQGWMNSSGHRANILNGGYRRIGAAAYETPEGTIYWCQQFLR